MQFILGLGVGVTSSLVIRRLQDRSNASQKSHAPADISLKDRSLPPPSTPVPSLSHGTSVSAEQAQQQQQQGTNGATQSQDRSTMCLPRISSTSPQPNWKPGQPQPHPFGDSPRLAIDPDVADSGCIYALGISAVTPRPIALISSQGADGSRNLSPYSYFNMMNHNPPLLTVGLCRSGARGGGVKDSYRNIMETGECVICIMSEWFVEAANYTCGDYPPELDEMALVGLTPLPSLKVKPSGVAESVCNMECKLVQTIETTDKRTGAPTGCIAIFEVVMFRLVEAATTRTPTGKVVMDPIKMLPVGRLGGTTYSCIAGLHDLPRPKHQDPGQK